MVWADDVRGPWSEPIDLKTGRIDPGHAVGPDGTRYLFLSAGYLAQLAPDGLSIVGTERKIYDGWRYPEDWVVEGFAQEGPKILKRGAAPPHGARRGRHGRAADRAHDRVRPVEGHRGTLGA